MCMTHALLLGQAAPEPEAPVAVKKEEAAAPAAAGPSEDAHAVGLLDRLAGARHQRCWHPLQHPSKQIIRARCASRCFTQ